MIVGCVCLSHSPLRDRNRPNRQTEERFNAALTKAAGFVRSIEPDLTIVFYPDHLNGFSYRNLPPFCIGIQATSIGDYGTATGRLDVPEERSAALARAVLYGGVDTAISHDMHVDHGGVQPIEWLSEFYAVSRVIPIFVNCASPPLPRFARVRALGSAVGEWAMKAPERILVVGSGGLSHDPPIPALATAAPDVRERMVKGHSLNHSQRLTRQNRAYLEGAAMAAGRSALLKPDAAWDRQLLDAFEAGELTFLDDHSDEAIGSAGGRGGHEARTWIAALSTLGPGYSTDELFSEVIDEWITGMGILTALPAGADHDG